MFVNIIFDMPKTTLDSLIIIKQSDYLEARNELKCSCSSAKGAIMYFFQILNIVNE